MVFRHFDVFWFSAETTDVSSIQDGLFRGCSMMRGGGAGKAKRLPPPPPPPPRKEASLSRICVTYPAIIKLGTIIPYVKKIFKIYNTP